MPIVPRMRGIEEMLASVLDPFHGSVKSTSEIRDQHVLGIDVSLDAETAAHLGCNAAHARFRHVKSGGDLATDPVHDLRCRPDCHRVGSGIVLRDYPAAFDGHGGIAVVIETVTQPSRLRGKHRCSIAFAHADLRYDIAR